MLRKSRNVILRHIVHGVSRECPVLNVERAGADLSCSLGPDSGRQEQHRRQPADRKNEQGRGKQASDPPCPEAAQAHRPCSCHLPVQMRGDQIAGDDEEDVHTDESTGQRVRPEVEQHDEKDSDSAKTLDLGMKPGANALGTNVRRGNRPAIVASMLWGRRRTGGQVDRSVDFGHSTSSRSKLRPILPSLSAGRDTQTHLVAQDTRGPRLASPAVSQLPEPTGSG